MLHCLAPASGDCPGTLLSTDFMPVVHINIKLWCERRARITSGRVTEILKILTSRIVGSWCRGLSRLPLEWEGPAGPACSHPAVELLTLELQSPTGHLWRWGTQDTPVLAPVLQSKGNTHWWLETLVDRAVTYFPLPKKIFYQRRFWETDRYLHFYG